MKEFADDNFKFEENDRKLSKQVENTVGKGEIACYEQFLLFPQCFQKACFPGASKVVIVWERVKMSSAICFNLDQSNILSSVAGLILLEKMMTFDVPEVNVFFKHCNQHFYLFPQCILSYGLQIFCVTFSLSSAKFQCSQFRQG